MPPRTAVASDDLLVPLHGEDLSLDFGVERYRKVYGYQPQSVSVFTSLEGH